MDIKKEIKLRFEKATKLISSDLEVYNSENRIPFSIKINYPGNRPTSIYCELSEGENFIEFWFNKETKKLYEIAIIAIQQDAVKLATDDWVIGDDFYVCYIDCDSELHISKPVEILRSDKSLCFFWGKQPTYTYPIAKNCMLGVDSDKSLCSVLLVNLTKEMVYEILGF